MKKFKPLLAIIGLLAIVLTVVACSGTTANAAEEAYVTIDINPSVELIVNGQEEVVYVNALNEDAEVLLSGLDLIGMNVDEATDLIIQTAIELGYIDVEASDTVVQVSCTSDTALGEQIRERVKAAVNTAFQNRGVYGRATDKAFGQEFVEEAEGYGVTPGFLFLAKAVVAVQDEITLEDALLMTQEDLRDILKDAKDAAKEVIHELRDQFIAERQAIHDEYQPQIEAAQAVVANLETQIATVQAQIDVESTPELVAQLNTLQADLVTAQDDLQALIDAMHAEITALREDFAEQSEALLPNIAAVKEQRRTQFMARVNQYFNNHPGASWKDLIEDYQQSHQGNGTGLTD